MPMPVGKTRMAAIIMATLKCLACGHDNKVGDESCLSCSSSLNLKLCSACEAINANRAERCHSCGSAFIAREPAAVPVLEDAVAFVDLAPSKWLPAKVRFVETVLPPRSRARAIALWTAPLVIVVAVLPYYLNGQPSAVAKTAAPVPASPAASQALAAPQARTEPARPVAKAPEPGARSASTDPKRPSAITHTRAGAETAPLAVTAPVATKRVAAQAKAAPAVKTAPAALAAPALAAPAAPAYGRVTHTQAPEPGTAPAVAPAAEAPPAVQPQPTALKDSSLACAPAVAALGLCSTK